jgi:hypothetical protein
LAGALGGEMRKLLQRRDVGHFVKDEGEACAAGVPGVPGVPGGCVVGRAPQVVDEASHERGGVALGVRGRDDVHRVAGADRLAGVERLAVGTAERRT